MKIRFLLGVILFFMGSQLYSAADLALEDKWTECWERLAHLYANKHVFLLVEKIKIVITEHPEVIDYQTKGSHSTLLHRAITCMYEYQNDPVFLLNMRILVTFLLEKKADLTLEMSIQGTTGRTPLELASVYYTEQFGKNVEYDAVLAHVITQLKNAMKKRNIPIREVLPWSKEGLKSVFKIDEW